MVMKTNGFIEGGFPDELKRVLRSVGSEWGDVVDDMEALQVVPLKGAMTNEVFRIIWPTKCGNLNRNILVRIYGEGVEAFFNRDNEIRTFECMSKHGQGPRLLGRFADGRVEEFIHARVLKVPFELNEGSQMEFQSPVPWDIDLLSQKSITSKAVGLVIRATFHISSMGSESNGYCCQQYMLQHDWIWEQLLCVLGINRNKLRSLTSKFTQRIVKSLSSARIPRIITLSAADLRDHEISALVAAKMREFHDLEMPGPRTILLWNRMRGWLVQAKSMCSAKDVKEFCLDSLENEINMLEKELSHDYLDMGFCHNDLQYGNIMLDEETRSITLIDYEYASFNPVAYDIANHFCEMVANYHSATPHILDYSKYPELEERHRFVHAYLCSAGKQPSEDEAELLLQEVEKYTLASHVFWGLWGIISGHVNKIEFDYMEYARQRFQQYWMRKQKLLASSDKAPDNHVD